MKIMIIGAGPAGVTAAETVRSFDRQADITMLTSEPYLPYSPPAMADHFILGNDNHLWRSPDWPSEIGLTYRQSVNVSSIEPDRHQVRLDNGEGLSYDRLLICSGARLYAPLEGAEKAGIYNFKSLSAAEELVKKVREGQASSAIVVGAGFIGMEIALLLRELGITVVQIEMLDQVMASMLDAETASIACDLMMTRGVEVLLNTKASEFVGNGKANGVRLESGKVLQADLLIAATGVKPNLEFLNGSGIEYKWGIQVDGQLKTNAADIYAAGDCIETPDLVNGKIFVHAIFPNAVEQGRVAGLNLAGIPTVYEGAKRMNSLKHLGLPIIAAGDKQGDRILFEKSGKNLRTIYLQEKRLVGFQLVGDIEAAGVFHTLMLQKSDVSRIEKYLLAPGFGEGIAAWNAISSLI